jgi:hypothetical protein
MSRIIAITIILIFVGQITARENPDKSLLWPTDASHLMTSSFAEFRDNHFHSGIDIKTWGKTGYKVFAVADGWVSRIRVSPFGYGRALYITLNDGRTVVYGHLQDFADPISQYVWNTQLNQGNYSVQLFPQKNQFPIRKGQIVAYTGESGVGPPHLHFEIRNSKEEPLNPLDEGINVKDSIKPTISQIAISPLNANSTVDGIPLPKIYTPQAKATEPQFTVSGQIGLAVKTFDRADGADNLFNVYRASLFINDSLWYQSTYDRFGFDENLQIRLERDWRLYVDGKGTFTRLYRVPGNNLAFVPKRETGVIDCQRFTSPIPFRIQVEDFSGNTAQIQGELIPEPQTPNSISEISMPGMLDSPLSGLKITPSFYDDFMVISLKSSLSLKQPPQLWVRTNTWNPIPIASHQSREWMGASPLNFHHSGPVTIYAMGVTSTGDTVIGNDTWQQWTIRNEENKTVEFPGTGIQLSFQSNSLWQSICLRIDSAAYPVKGFPYLSPAWLIHPEDIPLASEITVDWQFPPDESEPQQIGIYRWTRSDYWRILTPATYSEKDKIEANSDELGIFAVIRDDIPPSLEIIYPKRQSPSTRPDMEIRLSDVLSGLDADKMQMLIDDKPVIFEYDPDAQKLKFVDRRPLTPGSHRLVVEISDRAGNRTVKQSTFQIGGTKR